MVSVVIVVVGKLLLNKIKNRFFYDPQHRDRILHSYEAYFIDTKNVNTNSDGNNANDYNTLLHGIKVTVERHKIITYITQCHHPRIKKIILWVRNKHSVLSMTTA